jgi:hypothetical protein
MPQEPHSLSCLSNHWLELLAVPYTCLLKRELNSLSDICVGCFPSGTRKQEGKIWSYTLKRKDVSFIYMNQTSKPAYIFVDQLQASSFWELDGLYSHNSDWVCEQHWSQVDLQWQKMFGIHK